MGTRQTTEFFHFTLPVFITVVVLSLIGWQGYTLSHQIVEPVTLEATVQLSLEESLTEARKTMAESVEPACFFDRKIVDEGGILIYSTCYRNPVFDTGPR